MIFKLFGSLLFSLFYILYYLTYRLFRFFILKSIKFIFLYILFFLFFSDFCYSQKSTFDNLNWNEFLRRQSLMSKSDNQYSFNFRHNFYFQSNQFQSSDSLASPEKDFEFKFLPLNFYLRHDSNRPYVGEEFGMIPSKGLQSLLSSGIYFKLKFLHFQLKPEFVISQNLPFEGFLNRFSNDVLEARFMYWNVSDSPERFGSTLYKRIFLGQSSLSIPFGSFEFGLGNKNFWWGPGQWNSLIFSNSAPGFPYLSFNTFKPAKTFLGKFEGQFLIGKLNSSGLVPTQDDFLNSKYSIPVNPDWRYLNGLMFSYNPKWLPGLYLGYSRTYQYYNQQRPKDLKGWLPILEPMAKQKLFINGNSLVYDQRKQSQQIAIFSRLIIQKSNAEIYFQYGRRDHALNWREFFLNPEHARAYQLGFIKISELNNDFKTLQIRGEITHQQESVNRYLRYDLNGGLTWHTHGEVRGFSNYGQPLGVGIGTGSNVQTLEVSIVNDFQKIGISFERLENNQDFFYHAFGQEADINPWIDFSTSLLWNQSYKDLFLSAKLQGTIAKNYQWGSYEISNTRFSDSKDLFSMHSQINLTYFFNQKD